MKSLFLALVSIAALAACSSKSVTANNESAAASTPAGNTWEKGMDKDSVRKVIKKDLAQIRSCYDSELKSDSKMKGTLTVEFEIVDNGAVSNATVKSSELKNQKTENCILAVIKKSQFPAPPENMKAVIDYPFIFDNVAEKKTTK